MQDSLNSHLQAIVFGIEMRYEVTTRSFAQEQRSGVSQYRRETCGLIDHEFRDRPRTHNVVVAAVLVRAPFTW